MADEPAVIDGDAVEIVDSLPTEMEEKDYKFFVFSVNKRIQALMTAMGTVDQDILISFLRSAGANEQALDEVETHNVGLGFLQNKYMLGLQDAVQPDRKILRQMPLPPTRDEMVAAQVVDSLNGHAPTPIGNRAGRRHREE